MNRGGRKPHWLPKNVQSSNSAASSSNSPRLHVENQSSSYKPKNRGSGGISSVGSVSKWSDVVTPPNVSYKPSTDSFRVGNLRLGDDAPGSVGSSGQLQSPSDLGVKYSSGKLEGQTSHQNKISGSSELVDLGNKQEQASQKSTYRNGNEPFFDIFKTGNVFQLKAPLHVKNRERRHEDKRNTEGPSIRVLRPGMVHLRHYISLSDQVSLVQTCRNFGLSHAGFYEPSNRGGIGTVNRKMMILGKYWDTYSNTYVDANPIDGTKPHKIPGEFSKFAYQAIRDSHDHMRKQSVRDIERILPPLDPDICVVNFYSRSGRLGLHRDMNESEQSLRRGLPVVSISIGDSAEFVYGDSGDIDKAEKVVLESGDVLIFGGSSRLVYHGVSTIYPDTAPKLLLEETNLRPGRLNLTFRQHQ